MEEREAADVINNFGRDPIGEGEEERVSGYQLRFQSVLTDVPVRNITRI